MSQFSRYRPMVANLAEQALERAARVGAGDASRDIRVGLPAARVLLHDTAADDAWHAGAASLACIADDPADDDRPLRSPGGQWRDVYWPLVVHLYLRSYTKVRPTLDDVTRSEVEGLLARAADALAASPDAGTISFRLWRTLCMTSSAELALPQGLATPQRCVRSDDQQGEGTPTVEQLIARDDGRPPADALHVQDADEPLDFWTYRELAGLHALDRLARLTARRDWQARVEQVASFHLHHTQPDYTTYEPWGLPAFARSMQTSLFAEQQLHDATVHLAQRDGGGAVVIALLLADSFDVMSASAGVE
ncbi:hypothetical protein ACERK3_08670 [Phycisphaerales bacterium AB-hyl4]|uniref:Halocarboxylic acid dehydrogenase DehI n=1 Tax=Natronomicrosphaera hydrolytica TaxID=3242702 RepID=A0ABV4U601_9BACT